MVVRRFVWLLLVCSGSALASAVPLTPPAGVGYSPTLPGWSSTAQAVFNAGQTSGGLTASVSGKAVTVPASWRLASNAPRFVGLLVRASPVGWLTAAVVAWLATEGIEWANNQWNKRLTVLTERWTGSYISPATFDGTLLAALQQIVIPKLRTANGCTTQMIGYCPNPNGSTLVIGSPSNGTYPVTGYPGGTLYYTKADIQGTSMRPAVDADWDPLLNQSSLPDAVANDATHLAPLPLENPSVDTTPQTVPLSDPYSDPVTGSRFRDVAEVDPSVDGLDAEVQVYRQPLDANDQPDSTKSPEEQKDPCVGHEDRLGCMTLGPVPATPSIGQNDKSISLTPDAGWGPDNGSCPADLTASFLGQPLALSFRPVCDAATMFRPMVVGLAWVSSVIIALGIARRVS